MALTANPKINREFTRYLRFTYGYLLTRFKLNYQHVSVISHLDFDGMVSAALVLNKIPYGQLYLGTSRSLYKLLYMAAKRAPKECPHTIYILDLGISKEYWTRLLKAIRTIREWGLVEIHWIDHHQSPYLDDIRNYVNLVVRPEISNAAYLVKDYINKNPCVNDLLDLLSKAESPFTKYWRPVLKALMQLEQIDWPSRRTVIYNLAAKRKTPLTDNFYQKGLKWIKREQFTESEKYFRLEIYTAHHSRQFGVIEFYKKIDLYSEVQQKLQLYNLDFILVKFDDGSFSVYKNRKSRINLTPLKTLVGGKGHEYAFHFQPQQRVDDEFFRPLTYDDLIKAILEVI